MSTLTVDASAPRQAKGADLPRRERRFFTMTALVIALLVAVGFGWSTYVRTRPGATATVFGGPTLTPMVRAHAAVTTGWVLLLIAQTWLVASRRTAVHKKLGLAGGVLATGVVVFGWMVAVDQVRRSAGAAPPGSPGSLEFFIFPAGELFVFSILIALALYWRRVPRIHKRLMLLGTVALIPAATTRVPLGSLLLTLDLFGVPELLFVVALMLHDARTLRRVHPATMAGAALVLVVAAFRMPVASTGAWLAFASAVTR